MSYSGPGSRRVRWLQFVWREILIDRPYEATMPEHGTVTPAGGPSAYPLTIDPKRPSYNIDAQQATPFYTPGLVSAGATTFFDAPSAQEGLVAQIYARPNPPPEVTSRAHFVTYLVRGINVLYKVKTTFEWSFFAAGVHPTPRIKTTDKGKASAIEPAQRDVLVAKHAAADYLL